MYLGPDGKPTKDSREGWRSVGVPGSVAGLWEAWQLLGSKKKTWAELLAPAIDLADRGFVVDGPFIQGIDYLKQRLYKFCVGRKCSCRTERRLLGSTWRDPDLANVLRHVAAEGPAGPIRSRRRGSGACDERGRRSRDLLDLAAYKARWRTPIEYR